MSRALAGALLLALVAGAARADEPLRVGDRAPALGLADLDGGPVELPAGPVVIDFFATWCEPCHRALATLLPLVRGRAALILVDVGEPADVVRGFVAQLGLPPGTRVALDPGRAAFARFTRGRLPTTVVVDGTGTVRHLHHGFGPSYGPLIGKKLAGLAPR